MEYEGALDDSRTINTIDNKQDQVAIYFSVSHKICVRTLMTMTIEVTTLRSISNSSNGGRSSSSGGSGISSGSGCTSSSCGRAGGRGSRFMVRMVRRHEAWRTVVSVVMVRMLVVVARLEDGSGRKSRANGDGCRDVSWSNSGARYGDAVTAMMATRVAPVRPGDRKCNNCTEK